MRMSVRECVGRPASGVLARRSAESARGADTKCGCNFDGAEQAREAREDGPEQKQDLPRE